jgi:hypothetical protein
MRPVEVIRNFNRPDFNSKIAGGITFLLVHGGT